MNCAYHTRNTAVINCNGCGKPLCPACDHRIKGFPYCQDCIVSGVELLRNRDNSKYVPFVKRQTSPLVATILSVICPGLGAAYNGQTSKALVYFAVFVGLFQLAILTGMAIFVFGFIGMGFFAALDAWRTARMIRSGITPDGAENLLVKQVSGNPKSWGIVLVGLGALFFLRPYFDVRFLLKAIVPVLLIGLGIYLLRDFVFRRNNDRKVSGFEQTTNTPNFVGNYGETSFRTGEFEADYKKSPKV